MHSQRLCDPCFAQAIRCQTPSLFHMKYPWQLPAFKRGWGGGGGGGESAKIQVLPTISEIIPDFPKSRQPPLPLPPTPQKKAKWNLCPQKQTPPPLPPKRKKIGKMKPMFPKADTPPPSPQTTTTTTTTSKQTNKTKKHGKMKPMSAWFYTTNFKSSSARRDLDGRQLVSRSENSQWRRKWNCKAESTSVA